MRRIYCDESGIAGESILVVAGVIVHAEQQWFVVERYITELIKAHIEPEDRSGFSFQAKELFSGRGKVFQKGGKYSLERRLEIFNDVLRIPSTFKLPIVVGFIRRELHPIRLQNSVANPFLTTKHWPFVRW